MAKVEEAQEILRSLGLPRAQQNEMSALTLLALCGLRPKDRWRQAHRHSVTVTKGVMNFIAQEYGKRYAPNTRETFRRQVLHQFVQAHIADYNPDAPEWNHTETLARKAQSASSGGARGIRSPFCSWRPFTLFR